ncbi:hypothetical protein M0802_008864 [Mischocyttarus mexicanus]|nr:hypothetical protein M0802_008864 [Mischocyttarus mexicanus]
MGWWNEDDGEERVRVRVRRKIRPTKSRISLCFSNEYDANANANANVNANSNSNSNANANDYDYDYDDDDDVRLPPSYAEERFVQEKRKRDSSISKDVCGRPSSPSSTLSSSSLSVVGKKVTAVKSQHSIQIYDGIQTQGVSPSGIEENDAEQSRAEQSRAEQSRAKLEKRKAEQRKEEKYAMFHGMVSGGFDIVQQRKGRVVWLIGCWFRLGRSWKIREKVMEEAAGFTCETVRWLQALPVEASKAKRLVGLLACWLAVPDVQHLLQRDLQRVTQVTTTKSAPYLSLPFLTLA